MSDALHANFVKALTHHDRDLRRYLYALVMDELAVDEVMQETALTLWEHYAEYDTTRPFMPWACRFAYFKVLERRRTVSRQRALLRDDVWELVQETALSQLTSGSDREKALAGCLHHLSDADRELLRRRYLDGERVIDLADHLHKTVKNLYNRIDRLRLRLVDCIDLRLEKQRL